MLLSRHCALSKFCCINTANKDFIFVAEFRDWVFSGDCQEGTCDRLSFQSLASPTGAEGKKIKDNWNCLNS